MVNNCSKLEAYWPHNQRRSGRTLQWYQSGSLQGSYLRRNITKGNSKGKKKKESEDVQKGHLIRTCPKKFMDDAESSQDQQNQSNGTAVNQSNTAQPEVALKYPEFIHFNTDGILKGTDQGSWDDFWYLSKSTDKHYCSNLNMFCNIRENFLVSNLEKQKKFLFTYGMGEVIIKPVFQAYLIPRVYFAPEVSLNILSIDLLNQQGFEVVSDGDRFEKKDEMARFVEDVNPTKVHTFQEFVVYPGYTREPSDLASGRPNVPLDHWWLGLKFQLLVARDHAFFFVIVLLPYSKQPFTETMVNYRSKLEAYWPHDQRRSGRTLQWYQSESWKPPRKLSEKEYYQRQFEREKEERVRRCVRQITQGCKGMLRKKLEEIEAFNSSLHQNKLEKNKCFYCREKGHFIRTCPKKIMDNAESSQKQSSPSPVKENNMAHPEVTLKYPEFIHFNTDGILKGTDNGFMDNVSLTVTPFKKEFVGFLNLIKDDNVVSKGWDSYTDSIHFGQEFGAIAEILGLTRNDGDDVKKVYMVYLDVFVSYYKTARAPKAPAEAVEDSSLESYQWSVGKNGAPSTSQKGKEKIEHFGIKLEDKPVCIKQQTVRDEEKEVIVIVCQGNSDIMHTRCSSKE
ncbi:ARID DNA-binding domain-containing protein [Tanacetum coccineum]